MVLPQKEVCGVAILAENEVLEENPPVRPGDHKLSYVKTLASSEWLSQQEGWSLLGMIFLNCFPQLVNLDTRSKVIPSTFSNSDDYGPKTHELLSTKYQALLNWIVCFRTQCEWIQLWFLQFLLLLPFQFKGCNSTRVP